MNNAMPNRGNLFKGVKRMKITFDIPDSAKAFHGCLVYEVNNSIDLQLVTWDMPTHGLRDGMVVELPPKKHEQVTSDE